MLDALRSLIERLVAPGAQLFSAALEFVLIGAVVYAILRFLRGTRGEGLFRGIVFLLLLATLVVSVLADQLELERIKVLYPSFLQGVLLIALVAFQPEWRRALIRLGGTRWFGSLAGDIDRVIDAVVESVEYLSGHKIGALVAFERSTQLAGLMENGVRLDAEVTPQLLNTVFWPGSALHDMGLVISQNRVAAAAVQFPLTEQEGLDQSFGSRHRAALGLSEETDAVIVVVSEETGIVSVVERGKINRYLTGETLRALLRTLLTEQRATPSAPAANEASPPGGGA